MYGEIYSKMLKGLESAILRVVIVLFVIGILIGGGIAYLILTP